MPILYTKNQLARELKLDVRNSRIQNATPVCQVQMGSKRVDLFNLLDLN
jgi:hypothetical protein